MSIFMCAGCDRLIDADFDGCYELHGQLLCEQCYADRTEYDDDYIQGLDDGEGPRDEDNRDNG